MGNKKRKRVHTGPLAFGDVDQELEEAQEEIRVYL
jgi:hypothetical protein